MDRDLFAGQRRRHPCGPHCAVGGQRISTGGLSGHGIAAVVLGVTFSVLLAVGLMALVFYSNRSGQDDEAHHPDDR